MYQGQRGPTEKTPRVNLPRGALCLRAWLADGSGGATIGTMVSCRTHRVHSAGGSWTYMVGTAVCGPGSVLSVGKGVSAHYVITEDQRSRSRKLTSRQSVTGTYSLFNILVCLSCREVRGVGKCRGDGEDVGAVGEGGGVRAELAHRLKNELEAILQFVLVGCRRDFSGCVLFSE